MKIRLAVQSDFEVYKALFDGDDYDMLYRPIKSDIKPQKKDAKRRPEFDDETLKRWEEFSRRTQEKFENTLERPEEDRIYILENDKNVIIGFLELFRNGTSKWKLAYCGMKKGYQSQENFSQAIKLLLTQSRVKTVDVCVLFKSCKRRMEGAGFSSIGGGFYRIEAEKQV